MNQFLNVFRESLAEIYSEQQVDELVDVLKNYNKDPLTRTHTNTLQQADAVLISYADSVIDPPTQRPLQALESLLVSQGWKDILPVLHLLPFFPWDTDRGFSVCHFYKVASENGQWKDIHSLAKHVRLMFDFVANHASISNPLVQSALISRHLDVDHPAFSEHSKYQDFVIAFSLEDQPSEEEIAALSRPRANPVLTPYFVAVNEDGSFSAILGKIPAEAKVIGNGVVWTTFSRGLDAKAVEQTRQVDLNYANPNVFREALEILLFYAEQKASWIRLDAIGYLWKKLGSSSLHEPQTHKLIVGLHAALAYCAPELLTIAEVNEPQEQVLTYLGEPGKPESDLVYQFSHFPLAVHALYRADASWYRAWLASSEVAEGRQFITVLGSHDGMGMKPLRGIVPEVEIEEFAQHLVDKRGGLPNYASLPGGKKIVYEVCATAWELVNGASQQPRDVQLARYRVVVALGLFARGIPAFYLQGIIGAKNYLPAEGLDENRTTNRERFELSRLNAELAKNDSQFFEVYSLVENLLRVRKENPACCSSEAKLRVLFDVDPRVVAALRSFDGQRVCMLANVSAETICVELSDFSGTRVRDLLSSEEFELAADGANLQLSAYDVRWLIEITN